MTAPKEDSRCVPGARCACEDPARKLHTGALCERYGLRTQGSWVEPCVPHTSPDFSHRAPVPAPRAIWTPGVSFPAPVFLCRVPASTCVPLQSPCKHLCSFTESLQAPVFLYRVPASTCVPLQSPCKHLCSFAESLQAPVFLCRVSLTAERTEQTETLQGSPLSTHIWPCLAARRRAPGPDATWRIAHRLTP
jgi:hypothetical protein